MSGRPPRVGAGAAWDPLRDLLSLKDRLNRLFETVLRRGDAAQDEIPRWSPAADLRENAEGFLLTAELPGVRREDVRIRIESGLLILEGQRAMDIDARDADHLRLERSYGPFMRSFHLPAAIDERGVTATLRRGVLEVFVPKSAEGRARTLTISVS
jgi:HSP20 family protein